jgi:hypothetical protein
VIFSLEKFCRRAAKPIERYQSENDLNQEEKRVLSLTGLLELSLNPHYPTEDELAQMMEYANQHLQRINTDQYY